MDFLKSMVASAIAQGPPFPYTFGDKVDIDESIWTLYNGTRKEDGSNCSIFAFNVPAKRGQLPLAKNALRKLRTLRHPGVIKVLDTVETDNYIYIVTERVVPLRWHLRRRSLTPETIRWGLHSVARTIKFINDASSIHGRLKVGSIYTLESGEWRLGGFEVLSSVKEDDSVIYIYGSLLPDSARYAPPELVHKGWDVIKRHPHTAVDSFNFGTLIFETFNGDYQGGRQAGQTGNVPPLMHSSYKRLCNANPKARISVANFLDQGTRTSSFFDSSLIHLTEGLENLGVKTSSEREKFLDDLDQLSDDYPEEFFKMKILPELIKSVEFGGGGPKALGVVLKIASKLPTEDFETRITPFIIRAFNNTDRAIRVCLLDNLSLIIDKLSQKAVNDNISPQIITGFTDVQPVVREQTLKSVLVLIGKLSDRTINGDLLKQLAKTANDEQPGIRTNTTICLGKIARHLGTSSRSKVLIAAFTRSIRDPFVHGRNAALMALAATAEYFSEDDATCRILPAICPLLIDKEKLVRDQTSRTMDVYMQKIRKAAASMPETALPPQQTADAQPARIGTPQSSGASGWTGWAISSFTNKISSAAGEMQTAKGSNGVGASSSSQGKTTTASASSLHRQALKSPLADTSRSSSPATNAVVEAFTSDPEVDPGDWWGDMDDGGEEDDFVDSYFPTPETSTPVPASNATPFDDSEPDFAGWLAAQAEKKRAGSSKPLPKGLSKSTTTKKTVPKAAAAKKPTVTKKLDLKPKETEGDDDGWGDGW